MLLDALLKCLFVSVDNRERRSRPPTVAHNFLSITQYALDSSPGQRRGEQNHPDPELCLLLLVEVD